LTYWDYFAILFVVGTVNFMINVNPTRQELAKLKARLNSARRGHKLLKDKCDQLMKELLATVSVANSARNIIEAKMSNIHFGFAIASSQTSDISLKSAVALPKGNTKSEIQISEKSIMGVEVPTFSMPVLDESIEGVYGSSMTSEMLDDSYLQVKGILNDLLLLSEKEKTVLLLAKEIEKTRRRVNALEYIMIPELVKAVADIVLRLDEDEREETVRLMKI